MRAWKINNTMINRHRGAWSNGAACTHARTHASKALTHARKQTQRDQSLNNRGCDGDTRQHHKPTCMNRKSDSCPTALHHATSGSVAVSPTF